ncbi:MAG: TerB family tellurite resistance protein [Polyangiales bacterium]|jgi:tellurite resistance protein
MAPDETEAYAIATWARFNASVPNDLLRALSGAFALVAASDGELAKSEVDAFVQLLRAKAGVFAGIDLDSLETTFRDLADSLIADPEDGRLRALQCIGLVKGDPEKAEMVRSGAAVALAADGRARAPEEATMRAIRAALGLEA